MHTQQRDVGSGFIRWDLPRTVCMCVRGWCTGQQFWRRNRTLSHVLCMPVMSGSELSWVRELHVATEIVHHLWPSLWLIKNNSHLTLEWCCAGATRDIQWGWTRNRVQLSIKPMIFTSLDHGVFEEVRGFQFMFTHTFKLRCASCFWPAVDTCYEHLHGQKMMRLISFVLAYKSGRLVDLCFNFCTHICDSLHIHSIEATSFYPVKSIR